MAFNYEAKTETDAVLSVADAIRSSFRLAPLTDEQKLERRLAIEDYLREEQARASEERRAERDRQQAEAEAVARQESAAALAESNRQARIQAREKAAAEYRERQERQSLNNELAALRLESQESAAWRNAVRNAVAYQQRQTLINELEAAINPPAPPPPEPEVIYVEAAEGSDEFGTRDFNVDAWMKKPRSWW